MKSATEIRNVQDIRTMGTRVNSTNRPNKSVTYLDIYLLDRERSRLETELSRLIKRKIRVEKRLGEVRSTIEKQVNRAKIQKELAERQIGHLCSNSDKLKRLTLDY